MSIGASTNEHFLNFKFLRFSHFSVIFIKLFKENVSITFYPMTLELFFNKIEAKQKLELSDD